MKLRRLVLFLLSPTLFMAACQPVSVKQSPASHYFDKYKIANGFEIHLVASEPLIQAPVAMDFDNKGRIWVVEMRGYMPNLAGIGEDKPNGRITILEGISQNGVVENAKVFLDSLILPRAIAHVYGGLLYAAPPNLWFVEIDHDKPGKRTLVDSLYSDGGNVESQPNGLMMDIDNWIYSANSNFRYQLKATKWIKEPTSFRGQWGISKDNFGRLYYNSNEIQLAGDYVLPNTMIRNPYLKPTEAVDQMLTEDQRVFALHPTTVNRGAEKGILNKDSMLVNVTAACGPLIYRGDQFADEYKLNAFVCEPQANVIKRDILSFQSVRTIARQAYKDREFIACTDEGFRPVNLQDGPDGAMYVVDMHRGIMQHRAYATPYYRHQIAQKNLDTLLTAGRILRITNKNRGVRAVPNLENATQNELVDLLKDSNGWLRDRAQQLLILKGKNSVIAQLQAMVQDKNNPVAAAHALYTLQGLNALSFDLLRKAASSANDMLCPHALLLLETYASQKNIHAMEALVNNLMTKKDTVINLYLAICLGPWATVSQQTFLPLLAKLSQEYANNVLFQQAVISSLKGLEQHFKTLIDRLSGYKGSNEVVKKMLAQTIANKREGKMNPIFVHQKVETDQRSSGLIIFRSTCAVCHGADGEGRSNVAPPLNGSPYVEGSAQRLAMIILNGLTDSLHLNGKAYKFNGSMPNFGNNFNDQQIADVIEYLHNSFVVKAPKPLHAEDIKKLRSKHSGTLTEIELRKIVD